MRVIFWGTPDLAVPSLKALCEAGHEIAAVVTQPDRKQGRKQCIQFSPVKHFALAMDIPVLQPENPARAEFVRCLAQLMPEIMVVVAYGKIFTRKLLNVPCRYGWVNVHFSLLPKFRGASPVSATILAGEKETGVTIMRVVRKMDAGPLLAADVMPVSPYDTTASLTQRLEIAGASLLVKVLEMLRKGELVETPQVESEATYCSLLKKEDGLIVWRKSALYLERLVRAMTPWPGAYTFLARNFPKVPLRVIVKAAQAVPSEERIDPGTVMKADRDGIEVASGEGRLRITQLQREGKEILSAETFLQGTPIRKGDRFEEPQ